MDHIGGIDVNCDSTYMLMLEAQNRGFLLYHYTPEDLFLENGEVVALLSEVKLFPGKKEFFSLSAPKRVNLSSLDIIFIRQDPPFNMHYITTTYLLEKLGNKVLLINNPTEIRNAPEKLLACDFKEYMPETLVSENVSVIEEFANNFNQIIVKPLYACGGEGVSKHVKPFDKLREAIFAIKKEYNTPCMVQRYLPEIKIGDLRVILACGKIIGQVLRVPQNDSVAANFHAGGLAKDVELTPKQKKISEELGKILLERKLYFVGLDFIGDYLTEINVTSPTGIQEINSFRNYDITKNIWDEFLSIA